MTRFGMPERGGTLALLRHSKELPIWCVANMRLQDRRP